MFNPISLFHSVGVFMWFSCWRWVLTTLRVRSGITLEFTAWAQVEAGFFSLSSQTFKFLVEDFVA